MHRGPGNAVLSGPVSRSQGPRGFERLGESSSFDGIVECTVFNYLREYNIRTLFEKDLARTSESHATGAA